MEKRACTRIPANIEVRFRCNSAEYSGAIMDISEGGMFISTSETYLPFDVEFEIPIFLNDAISYMPVNLVRVILSPNINGIGVKLRNPTKKYLEFVNSLKSSQ